jgi:peptidase E
MKTKIILHGGFAKHVNKFNDKFFKEILKLNKNELNILIVLFAKPKSAYKKRREIVIRQFTNNNTHKKILNFKIADKRNFPEQIKESDIIFIYGGNSLKLLKTMQKFRNFKKLINGKIVVGESAGAYVLSTCFYDEYLKGCFNGLKIVPVKIIGHYKGSNRYKLQESHKNLKELLLAEHKYKVFRMNNSF